MAIGPEQLRHNFLKEVDEFEATIDASLLKWKFSHRIMVYAPKGMTYEHFKILKERYLKVGWDSVKQEHGDQRDPYNAIVFELNL